MSRFFKEGHLLTLSKKQQTKPFPYYKRCRALTLTFLLFWNIALFFCLILQGYLSRDKFFASTKQVSLFDIICMSFMFWNNGIITIILISVHIINGVQT